MFKNDTQDQRPLFCRFLQHFKTKSHRSIMIGLVAALAAQASGQIAITEWMYSGNDGEFIEFTNVGDDAIDMTGWSVDDDSQTPGTVDLSSFGIVQAGQSVVLTDVLAADFIAAWSLSDTPVIGESTAGLSRNDQINLYDSSNTLIAQLNYGDEVYPGTPRTQYISCNIPASGYDLTTVSTDWTYAAIGDNFGSRTSLNGDIASPGRIVGYSLFDYDMDGDVGLSDFAGFIIYFGLSYDSELPDYGLTPNASGYIAADPDQDFDIDLIDFAAFTNCYSGEDNPAVPSCGCSTEEYTDTIITLNGDSISVDGTGVTIDGTTATITSVGTYIISGTLNDGQIAVSSPNAGTVKLVLNGAAISSSTSAAINIMEATYASIVLADGTANTLSDASTYVYEDATIDEPSSCLFSDESMAISGTGSLSVYANYNDAIVSKDELIIYDGTINVTSVDDGIRGKDYLLIKGGDITLNTTGDALKSDNDEDTALGYITIDGGTLNITSGGDGISAETNVTVNAGDITVKSGGGYTATIADDLSAKAIKGLVSVAINGGTLSLNSADDALHSNDTITVTGGSVDIASADDAVHADLTANINGGTLNILDCYEGIEAANITITDGDIDITCDEDGITADETVYITGGDIWILAAGGYSGSIADDYSAKGIKGLVSIVIDGGVFTVNTADDSFHSNDTITINDGSFRIASGDDGVHADSSLEINGGTMTIFRSYEGLEAAVITINDGTFDITTSDDGINVAGGNDGSGDPWTPPHMGGDPSTSTGDYFLYINGGYIAVNAAGDGLDANGSIVMTGGTVIVNGPTESMNGPLDYDGTFNISGGTLVAVGSSQMAQAPSTTSTQRSVKITYSQWQTAGNLVHIENSSTGANLLTFASAKNYQSCVFSSPDLTSGTSYKLYGGGSSSGTAVSGLYLDGTYTAGTQKTTFTASSIVTNVSTN